jgi:aspartate/methionine/tyrosine aminotransferase
MARLASTVAGTPHSGIRVMADLARSVPDVLNLGVGDPNFVTPPHIIESAAQAARDGFTKYTPSDGYVSLRELLAAKVRERNGLDASVEQVVVTSGGCGGLFTSLLVLLDPGDEILLPDPGWANYPPMAHVLNARPVLYPLDPARGWAPDLDALESLVGARSKAIILNSPGNPTGAVSDRDVLADVLDLARRKDLWVISDECYDEIVFDGEHISTATVGDADRVLTVFTFSKSYAMTGWRLGYVVAPPEVAAALAKAQEPVVGNASSISQKGGEAALSGPQDCVRQMREAYRERRDIATALLDEAGVGYVRPRGAFYLMADVSPAGGSLPFAKRLLQEEHVSVVPGSAFGPGGEGWVRVSLCVDPDVLREGLVRLAAAVDRSG